LESVQLKLITALERQTSQIEKHIAMMQADTAAAGKGDFLRVVVRGHGRIIKNPALPGESAHPPGLFRAKSTKTCLNGWTIATARKMIRLAGRKPSAG
jgi:hypothetical protein